MLPQVLGALVLAFVAFSMWRMTRKPKAKKAKKADALTAGERPALGSGGDDFALESGGYLALGASTDPETMARESAMENLRDDVIDLVQRQPEEIAVLLRSWLADRRAESR
jgi:flagellar biosynthesis/type III secretory pathway M-ring protein FliF/YscJ